MMRITSKSNRLHYSMNFRSMNACTSRPSSCASIDRFVDALQLIKLGFDGVTSTVATGRPSIHPVADAQALYLIGYLLSASNRSRRLER